MLVSQELEFSLPKFFSGLIVANYGHVRKFFMPCRAILPLWITNKKVY